MKTALFILAAVSSGGAGSPASAAATFQRFDNPGGGTLIAGTLGTATLNEATAAVLKQIHSQFGAKPQIGKIAENPAGHSVALFFTESKGGQAYSGISIVQAPPGAQAGGAVLYDTAKHFPSSVGPMLKKLGSLTSGPATAGASAQTLSPAEPLVNHTFTDGTGSMGVAPDWKFLSGGGGSADAEGPNGEIVAYDLAINCWDQNNASAVRYLRSLPAVTLQYQRAHAALLAYTSDPVRAWNSVFATIAHQNGKPAPSFTVTKVTPMSSGRVDMSEIAGSGTIPNIPGNPSNGPGQYIAFVQVMPENTLGQWAVYSTFVFVPTAHFGRTAQTAAATLASIHINFGAVAAESAAIRQAFQKQFESEIANDRAADAAREARGQAFLAQDAATQDEMHKQAVGMENYALDRAVVVDSSGNHSTVGSNFASALVQGNSEFHIVPPSQLLQGVDY